MRSKVSISPDGSVVILGLEKSDQCHTLSDMGARAGKVTSDQMKDHPPVQQDVMSKAR